MKAIITLAVIIFTSTTAFAQNNTADVKVQVIEMGIAKIETVVAKNNTNTNSIARLYKFKNSRVKKALSFTVYNKIKMA